MSVAWSLASSVCLLHGQWIIVYVCDMVSDF